MNRILGRVFAALGVAALAAMTPSCAHNDQSIFVRGVASPPVLTTNGVTCTYSADLNSAALLQGTLDVALVNAYSMNVVVGNQLVKRGDALNVRAESNRVQLQGAIVRVSDVNDNTLSEFTTYGATILDPASGSDPSYGVMQVVGIDAAATAKLATAIPKGTAQLVLAHVRAFGVTLGGVDVESQDYQFPISVCNGCLVDFSTGTDPAQPLPNCAKSPETSSNIVYPCTLGQDQRVPCQLCQGNPACTP